MSEVDYRSRFIYVRFCLTTQHCVYDNLMIACNYVLIIRVAHTCSALLIAIDNINKVCEIGLYTGDNCNY